MLFCTSKSLTLDSVSAFKYSFSMRILRNVRPTAEQLLILNDTGPGFRLIRGAAGSGKTTVALLRLRQLCASRSSRQVRLNLDTPVKVLVLTFNRTLRGYVEHLTMDECPDNVHINIATFSRWARNLCGPNLDIDDEADDRIVRLLQKSGFKTNVGYFVDEVKYILGRFAPDERSGYLEAIRSGRGRAPVVTRQTRRKLLDDVIPRYEEEKSRIGKVDWNDIALEAIRANKQHYDVVVVDETQDFSANQIRAVISHLKEDHTTTFIIDAVQRIYPQGFRWKEVGIEFRPETVYTLRRNYRNTVEIARFATPLVRNLPMDEDGALPDPSASKSHGPLPKVIAGRYSAQIGYMLDYVQGFLDSGDTVAILHPKGGGWFDFTRETLWDRDIPFCELTRKSDWPTGPEKVALSTTYSAKGLEFDHVLMPGLNQEVAQHGPEEGDGKLESLCRLVAMGIGRARKTVSIGYKPGEQSTLIGLLDRTTYDFVEV